MNDNTMIEKNNNQNITLTERYKKFYSEEALNLQVPNKTIYDYLLDSAKSNSNVTALNYFDRKISYGVLAKNIEAASNAFAAMGVKKGDVVTLLMPTVPETIYSLYALNKIGAVAHFVDPRIPAKTIKQAITEAESQLIVIIDLCHPKVDKIIDETNVSKIVSVSSADSLPMLLNAGYKLKENISYVKGNSEPIPKNSVYIKWHDFIKNGKYTNSETCSFEKDTPAVIVRTGGTTGIPKGVVLSNENINSVALEYKYCGIENKPGQVFLDIMPPFLAYGLIAGIHMPLSLGMTNVLIPQFDPTKFDQLLLKYKPAHFMGVPTHYEPLLTSDRLKGKDLSFLISPGAGGDTTNIELEKKINSFLMAHACETKLAKGYGMTELSSAVCVCIKNECNELGSVGIPLPLVDAEIRNPITKERIENPNEIGEWYFSGPSVMLGYLKNEEENNKIFYIDENGKKWIKTGDLGYVNEDGLFFHQARSKRMIIRPDGHNVFPSTIENVLATHPAVAECAVVGVNSIDNQQGKLPKAVVVLKDDFKGFEDEVQGMLEKLCSDNLPERDVAYYYEFVDKIPMTPAGKVDFKALESTGIEKANSSDVKITKLIKTIK